MMKARSMVAALFAVCCVTAPTISPQAAALAVLQKYDEAWLRKDVAAFEALLSPAYVYFTSSGGTMDRAAVLSMLASPQYHIDSGSRSELHIYESGSVMIVSTRWKGRGTYEGKSFVDDQRCSVVIALGTKPAVLMEHCTNLQP